MDAVTLVLRWLGLDARTWGRLGPGSLWTAGLVAVGASGVIAFNRFGGGVVDGPRGFLRVTMVGVWGWIALGLAIWLLVLVARRGVDRAGTHQSPWHTVAVVGAAHLPLLVFGLVVFLLAGVFQQFGPGFGAAVFVLAFWLPAQLVVGVRAAHGLSWVQTSAIVLPLYALWFAAVGDHLLGQITHLL